MDELEEDFQSMDEDETMAEDNQYHDEIAYHDEIPQFHDQNNRYDEAIPPQPLESTSSHIGTRKKTYSSVWKYFNKVKIDNKFYAKCKNCDQKPYVISTSNLRRHAHFLCPNRVIESHIEQRVSPFDQAIFREKINRAIMKHNLPYSFVEYKGIRDAFNYVDPNIRFWCRNTSQKDIVKIYEAEKVRLKRFLSTLTCRVSLTSDLWTSIAGNGFMSLTAHYIDDRWRLQKKVLIFRNISTPHDGKSIGSSLISCMREWGLDRKIFSITLDNAAYNDGVVNSLKSHFRLNGSLICNGDFLHIRCGAHILNLIVQDGLKVIDGPCEKIRDSVKYIKGENRRLKFAECVRQMGLKPTKKLIQDVRTRWNSTFSMIDSALFYRLGLEQLSIIDAGYDCCPSPEEWNRVGKIAKFLKPFYEMTLIFSGTNYPTANLYILHVWAIHMLLKKEIKSDELAIKNMAIEMKPKFEKYWNNYCPVLSIAMVLDPRYKLSFVKYAYEMVDRDSSEEKVETLLKTMKNLFNLYLDSSLDSRVTRTGISMETSSLHDDLLAGFDARESLNVISTTQSQLELYLAEPRIDRLTNLDILEYWKDSKYKELAKMARDVMSIPITSVASESVFSTGGRIFGKYRTTITPPNVEALVCGADWDEEDYDSTAAAEEENDEELSLDIAVLIPLIASPTVSPSNP